MQTYLSIQQTLAEPQSAQVVVELLQGDTVLNRCALAKELCRRLDLRDPKGDWRTATTSKALRDLEAQGFLTFPGSTVPRSRHWNSTRLNEPVKAPSAVPKRVEDVQGLQLVEATTQDEIKFWNELMVPMQRAKGAEVSP